MNIIHDEKYVLEMLASYLREGAVIQAADLTKPVLVKRDNGGFDCNLTITYPNTEE